MDYDARRLADDGRAASHLRTNNEVNPIDVPAVWLPDGTFTVLPVVGTYSQAYVNAFTPSGIAVGNLVRPGQFTSKAGYWNQSTFVELPDAGMGAAAYAGNDSIFGGDVFVPGSDGSFDNRAAVWIDEQCHQVTGIDARTSRINNINRSGYYVGTADTRVGTVSQRLFGFIGRDGTAQPVLYPGIEIQRTTDINDDGWIIGGWTPDGSTNRAYIANAFGTEFFDLGLLPGTVQAYPLRMNNNKEVVGFSDGGLPRTALYWPTGATQPIDLNTLVNIPGETLVEAMDINNAGQILTRGFNGYYILTPVPEPSLAPPLAAAVVALRRRS